MMKSESPVSDVETASRSFSAWLVVMTLATRSVSALSTILRLTMSRGTSGSMNALKEMGVNSCFARSSIWFHITSNWVISAIFFL